ncbi:fumarylacetoacetate hydrolase family protein [Herbaspirillum sp. SJZ107]|uniref:fumarylacetoacetate hydrolase family protein n=1 Tax=Herbaspirillum sp. SJZ107 TaxID=2572881 RepID=UPI00114DD329|nr:fumarylacetoacetate hydrolase family protein [Herbaspirillum sp. SJZ107]TQK03480.1 2-keto-4-pentenoate hydratase/2-oxohepta-3-ene-1,7-dioic acid hydratase in catechol pathway [Herbaspirillum sp. SJZ107]
MRIVAYEIDGKAAYGVLSGDQIINPGKAFLERYPDVRSVLDGAALPGLREAITAASEPLALANVTLTPPVNNPRKVFCVGLNYKSHVAETKRPDAEYPSIFVRFADSLTAHGAGLLYPGSKSEKFDYEGELAVVIGKAGQDIEESDAMDYVAGYACFNDATVRDWQRHTHQWTPGKNFPGTGAFGPALVTADEVGDITQCVLTTRLNGQVMQHASLSDLIFTLPVIISYLSRFTPLSPGDVIATGTPGGVGDRREPPLYMKPGDTVEVEISGVGLLRNTVTAA